MSLHMAELITALREERGMTQSEFGVLVGSHQVTVSKWERGENIPRSRALVRIALACGVNLDDAFDYAINPNTPLRRLEPGAPQTEAVILTIISP